MIDYLKNKYIDEARDLVEELESSLLLLEDNPGNPEIINRIFRALHTLKGSGSMFGFDLISEFTHGLETVYDEIRGQRLLLSPQILNLTLRSVDIIRKLLIQGSDPEQSLIDQTRELKAKILEQPGLSELQAARHEWHLAVETEEGDLESEKQFSIHFEPGPDILKTGNNPLYMLDELITMGDASVKWIPAAIPLLEEMDVHRCYSSWDIELKTVHSELLIKDVFLFIEEDSQITIHRHEVVKPAVIVPEINTIKENLSESPVPSMPVLQDSSSTIRVSSLKLDRLMNLVSELVTLQARLDLMADQTANQEFTNLAEALHKLSRQLRDTTFDICMVPLQSIVTRFQRLVRDLSADTGKNVRFIVEGTDTELDKTIIETITDPLLHIIRNSMDHGIEMPADRKKAGKPEVAIIRLRAFYQGPNVCIEISDDGAGINGLRVLNKARERGLVSKEKELSEKEIYDLLFQPGFSTASTVSSISGRGVGLDVVRQKINSIRGEVRVDSTTGEGTTFMLKLPLTLSIIDGLLVDVSGERFILPLEFVSKIVVIQHEEIAESYKGLITVDEQKIPFFNLHDEFHCQGPMPDHSELIIVNYSGKRVGLAVDTVIGEYQVVIKPLGKVFTDLNTFSGAAILGDGGLALVLDIHRMISEFSGNPGIIIY